ncbi:MAG: hypothetical protein A2248_21380 [Candidatus Raymondbacteria bacterium RIFOXYA2_FULL_49_16]|uniref:FlgD Ig-like domain-containing protein n=1 Tax=Candidatus Raymondbacteria bacterium RIFOXYD12_FULL_49_13 TaxID=1817890 RepID=A0A1F7FI26_UNCRA|nr:MAG: hypothetical protein A2248_21380 [Candidatus Raymondbacteria bacterium RIFOXYA2_FULL_49_16]OGK06340.1 MAG: hypothetical protein A2519_08700 [Candidatus Raymondbacteria bacterium RIFOXYD12_FULL_49_13]OGP40674.1 MAG: hypothetical protein A2324_03450 [Candidatus Raymondbacteria bacterium RIFOXYB2_FULL_49_35]
MCKPLTPLMLMLGAIVNIFAAPIDYSGCEVIKLEHTKDAWLSSYPGEQNGNFYAWEYYRFHTNSHLLIDFDVSSLPAFSEIAGVQLAFKEDEPWKAFSEVSYNCIRSDNDWNQATFGDREFTSPAPAGDPSYTWAQTPDVPWKTGLPNIYFAIRIGAGSLTFDGRELVRNKDSVYNIFIDLDKTILKDLLEGNSNGLCLWGGSMNIYIWRMFQLRVYTGDCRTATETNSSGPQDIEVNIQPNPFSSGTTISLTGNGSGSLANARLALFDVRGALVCQLPLSSNMNPGLGNFHWDGTNSLGQRVKGGVYVYRLTAFVDGKKVNKTGRLILSR